jgi:hypothetical protein
MRLPEAMIPAALRFPASMEADKSAPALKQRRWKKIERLKKYFTLI